MLWTAGGKGAGGQTEHIIDTGKLLGKFLAEVNDRMSTHATRHGGIQYGCHEDGTVTLK